VADTEVTVRTCELSSAGPAESFAVKSAAEKFAGVSSLVFRGSLDATGASFTSVTLIETVEVFEKLLPSFALKAKLSDPLKSGSGC